MNVRNSLAHLRSAGRLVSQRSRAATTQQLQKRGVVGPTKGAYEGNPHRHLILEHGEKPAYLQEITKKTRLWPLAVVLLLPIVLSPLYVDFFVKHYRENGTPKIREYEEHRLAKKEGHAHGAHH